MDTSNGNSGGNPDGNSDDNLDQIAQMFGVKAAPAPTTNNPYRPLIEKAAKRYGVDPDLIAAQMTQESSLHPNAVSPKGARGLMQLEPATAARFGVRDIYDPAQNIEGGVKYMKFLLDRYQGDVGKALAGYNAGEGRVDQYGGIPPFRETQDYVRRILNKYRGAGYHPESFQPDDSLSAIANYFPDDAAATDNPTAASVATYFNAPAATDNGQQNTAIEGSAEPAQPNILANLKAQKTDLENQITSRSTTVSQKRVIKKSLDKLNASIAEETKNRAGSPSWQIPGVPSNPAAPGPTFPNGSPAYAPIDTNTAALRDTAPAPNAASASGAGAAAPSSSFPARVNQPDAGAAGSQTPAQGDANALTAQPKLPPSSSPVTLQDSNGATYLEAGNRDGLQPNQVRVRNIATDKSSLLVATKTDHGYVLSTDAAAPAKTLTDATGQTNSAIDDEYKKYLTYTRQLDSLATRKAFHDAIESNPELHAEVSAKTNSPKVSGSAQAAGSPSPQTIAQPVSQPTPQLQSPTSMGAGTFDNLQKETFGSIPLDGKYDQKPTVGDIRSKAQAALYGANFGKASEVYQQLTGQPLETASVNQDMIDRHFDPKTKTLSGLDYYGNAQVKRVVDAFNANGEQGVKDVLAAPDKAKTDLAAMSQTAAQTNNDWELRQQAIKEIQADIDANNDPLAKMNPGAELYKPMTMDEPTINSLVQSYKDSSLDTDKANEAVQSGENLNKYLGENLGGLVGGIIGSGGRVWQSAAGIVRPLSALGITQPFNEFSKISKYAQGIEQTSGGKGAVSTALKFAGALPGDTSQLVVLSELPGSNAVIGFAAHSGLQSAGSGANRQEIGKQILKGGAMGALFPISSVVGDAAKTISPLLEPIARIGTVGVGTTGIELASGTPLDKSVQAGVMNGLLQASSLYGDKLLGKIARIWSNGKPNDVQIDGQGNVSLVRFKDQSNPNRVDFEMVLDPKDGVYKATSETNQTPKQESVSQPVKAPAQNQSVSNRGNAVESNNAAPRELEASNPQRIETPQSEAVQKAATDTRAQKIADSLKGNDAVSIDQLQKSTRFNKSNVEDAVMLLYAAKQVEILPDNRIRFIGGDAPQAEKSLFERAGEISAPREPINLPKSSAEDSINAAGATVSHSNPDIDGKPILTTTGEGKAIVANENNKSGISVVKNQSEELPAQETDKLKKSENLNTSENNVKESEQNQQVLTPTGEKTDSQSNENPAQAATSDPLALDVGAQVQVPDRANGGTKPGTVTKIRGGKVLVDTGGESPEMPRKANIAVTQPARISGKEENLSTVTAKNYENLPAQKQPEVKEPKPVAKVITAARPKLAPNYNTFTLRSDLAEKYKNLAETGDSAKKLDVFTERGTKAQIAPKVVDASDLLTSLDEGYPPELQPRDRSRAASKAQISEIANKLNPEFLGDSPKASDGRPLVVPVELNGQTKYAVISGNGRTAAIRQAYNSNNENSQKYAEFAKARGSEPHQTQPVYVGVVDPNEIKNLPEFARQANESATAQMSATEQAKSDAERLDPEILNKFVPADDGSIHAAANRDFTRAFLQRVVPTSEQGRLVDADGKLNQDGASRIRNAIFAKAFGDSESGLAAIQRMAESTDNNVKNITNGLLAKAGQIAALKEAAKAGTRHKEFDIAPDLARAMEKYADLKDAGTSVDEYIKQGHLFGAETTPFQTRIMQVFDHHKRSPKAIRSIVGNFLAAVEAIGDPNQKNLFGESRKPNVESIFEGATRSYENSVTAEAIGQIGLFGQGQGRENQSVGRAQSDVADQESIEPAKEAGTTETGNESSGSNQSDLEDVSPIAALDQLPAHLSESKAVETLVKDLENLHGESFNNLLANARIKSEPDGIAYINAPAAELIRRALGDNPDVFLGVYLSKEKVSRLGWQFKDLVGHETKPMLRRMQLARLAELHKDLAPLDGKTGLPKDAAVIVTGKNLPKGWSSAVQEELSHRADAATRPFAAKDMASNAAARKAAEHLKTEGYDNLSDEGLYKEVLGKMYRDDAETALNLPAAELDSIKDDYARRLLDSGRTPEEIAAAFENVSESGKEFATNVRQNKPGNFNESGRGRQSGSNADNESDKKIRQGQYEGSSRLDAGDEAARLAELQRKGVLDRTGKENEQTGIAKPESDESLYAKNSATRKALNLIDKALADVTYASPTRAIENVVNKGLQQLKEEDEPSYEAVLKLAGTASQVTVDALAGNPVSQTSAQAAANKNISDLAVELQNAGLAIPLGKGQTPTQVGGHDAAIVRIGNSAFAVPKWLNEELKPVLAAPNAPNIVQKMISRINIVGMTGPLDAYFHGLNLYSTVIGATPYVGVETLNKTLGQTKAASFFGKTALVPLNTPVTKWLTALSDIALADPEKTDPQVLKDMAEAGVIPAHYGRETYSNRLAGKLAAHKVKFTLAPFLSGPKGIDIRARIVMWNLGKHINPKASAAEMADFVNQLGIYNRMLESQFARAAKASQLAPFFTAGTTMPKNAVLMLAGKSPLPTENMPFARRAAFRAMQQFSAGSIGILGLWVAASLLYRGMLPWNDRESRFLQIPLNKEHRRNWLVKQIYGDNDKTAYVGLGILSPLVERGAKALGVSGAYDNRVLGGNAQQNFEAGAVGAMNTIAHPLTSGPFTKAAITGISGKEPQFDSLRDYSGKYNPSLWNIKDMPKNSGMGRNALEGLLTLNPMLGGILHALGVNRDPQDPDKLTKGETHTYLKTIFDTVLPRLDKGAQDRDQEREFVARQRKAIESQGRDIPAELREKAKQGEDAGENIREMLRSGEIKPAKANQIFESVERNMSAKATELKAAKSPFKAVSIFRNASDAEKEELLPYLMEKGQNAKTAQNAEIFAKVINEYREKQKNK